MRHRLRLFTGEQTAATLQAEPDVSVTLGELAPILAQAVRTNRAWLRDFEEDRVQISADLYEILTTFWNMRPSA